MLRRRKKADLPRRRDPGQPAAEPCGPGSIEQQLDMCENGELRGDEIEHTHGMEADPDSLDSETGVERNLGADQLLERFRIDMSEPNREGDELSGDEHSAGLQGGEPDLEGQEHIDEGIPGEERTEADSRLRRRGETAA